MNETCRVMLNEMSKMLKDVPEDDFNIFDTRFCVCGWYQRMREPYLTFNEIHNKMAGCDMALHYQVGILFAIQPWSMISNTPSFSMKLVLFNDFKGFPFRPGTRTAAHACEILAVSGKCDWVEANHRKNLGILPFNWMVSKLPVIIDHDESEVPRPAKPEKKRYRELQSI
jgi:hypothetical protein